VRVDANVYVQTIWLCVGHFNKYQVVANNEGFESTLNLSFKGRARLRVLTSLV